MPAAVGLSDPGMEDSLYDVESMRRFAGVDLESVPDDGFEVIIYPIEFKDIIISIILFTYFFPTVILSVTTSNFRNS